MINVSNDYKERMKESRDFRNYAEITFVDGSKMTVDASNFTASNNSLMDGASTSSFPIGVAVSKSAQIELINDEQQFQGKDFFGAKIRLYTDFQLDEVDPWVGRNLLKGSHKNPESVSSKGWNYIILILKMCYNVSYPKKRCFAILKFHRKLYGENEKMYIVS